MKNFKTLRRSRDFCLHFHFVKKHKRQNFAKYKMDPSFANFPHIQAEIFRNLDWQDLQNCRLVCKSWNSTLTSPSFWLDHVFLREVHVNLWRKLIEISNHQPIFTDQIIKLFWKLEKSNQSRSPLFMAAKTKNEELTKFILESDIGETPYNCIYFASQFGHEDVLEFMEKFAKSEDFRQIDSDGRSPLHLCAMLGHSESVQVLLKHYTIEPLDYKNSKPSDYSYAAGEKSLLDLENFS